MDGMDDIDEFLNSIEDLTASHSAEESGGAIDPELEALFDDFNSMIDTKKKESTENEESVLKVGVVEKNTYDLSVENVDELEDDDVVGVLKHHEHIVDRSNSLSDTEKTSSSSIGASLPTTENTTTSTRDKARRKVVPPPVVREKRNKDKPSYIFGKEEESEPVRDTISSQSSYPSQSDTEIITNNSVDVDADVDAEPQHDETNKKGETISLALAPDADEFMTWLDHVNVKLEGGDEGKQRDTGTGKHGLALASSLTSVADHIPSPKTTLPMPPSGIASGGSSTSSSGSSGKYAASVNMDAFFSEVFGPTHITTQTQAIHQTHAIEGVEECAVVAAGRNISQQRQASPVSVISCARLPSMDITSDHVNTRDTPAMLLPHPLSLIQNDLFISYMRHVNESGNGNDKGMTVHRARELLYQHRYIPTQHRVGIYLYLLSEGKMSAATAVSAMDVKSATAMLSRSSISRIAIDSAAAVSNVKARCFNIAASASSGNGSVRSRCNNDEDKRLQKTLYDLLVLFCANKSVPYHPLYMYLISPVVCCEPALLASYSSLSSQEQEIVYTNVFSTLHNLLPLLISHSPIIDLPSQPHCMHRPQLCIGIATRATSQCLRQLLAYHNPVLADHMEKTVPGWEQPMMWDTGANNGNGKSLVLGVAEMQEKLYGSGIDDKKSVIESNIDGCESDVNIKGSSRLSSDGSASGLISDIDRIFGALSSADANLQNDQLPLSFDPSTASSKGKQAETSGKPFVSGHISIHFMCNIFTASVPYAQSLCLQDWIITSGERFAGVYLTAALLDIFSIFLLNMTGTEAREWLLQIAEGEGQWFKSSLLPSHHFFPNDSKPITEYSLQQGLDWRSFVSGWIHAASALRRQTPIGFRAALAQLDRQWAQEVALRDMNIDITSGGSSVSTNSGLKGERHFGEASHSTTDATRINTSNYFSTESQLQSSSALPPLLMDIPPTVSAEIANTSTSGRSMMASFRRLSLLAASTAETMTASLARSVVTTGNNSPPCGSASASSSAFTSTNDIVVQSSASNTSISVYKRHIMIQDRYLPSTSLSPLHAPLKYLWSSPQEVIPCALSLGVHTAAGVSDMPGLEPYKRPVPSPPLSSFYMDALKSANSTDDVEKQKEDSISLPTSLSIPPLDALTPEAQGYMQGKGNIYVSGARSYDAPFYFCLDYRTPAERAHTGLFPKSLLLDKHFLNDAEKLAEVLAMLEPLAQNVHLCIVGSGETYVRYSYMHTKVLKQRLQGQGGQGVGQQGSMSERMGVKLNIGGEGTASGRLFALARSVTGINKQHDGGNNSPSASSSAPIAATTDTTSSSNSSHTGDEEYQNFTDTNWDDSYPNTDPALVELLGDYRRQLASIATFFMRRSFKHVSVLDGGFCGALKFLVGSIGKSIDTIPSSSSSRSSTGDGEKGKAGDSPDPHQHHWKMVKARLTGLLVDCNPEMIRCILTDDHDFDAATGTDMGISIGKSGDCGGGSSSSHIGGDFGNGSSESIDSKSHGGGEESLLRSEEQGQRRAYADDMQSHASEVGPDDLLKHYMDIAQGVERRAKVEFDTSSKLSSRVKSAGVSMSSGFASLGGNMKKRFSMFGSGSSTVDESDSNRREDAVGNGMMDKNNGVCINTAPAFVIDDDDEDSDCTPPASPTSNTTTMAAKIAPVAKTEAEKAEALAVHKLNGLQRGDVVTITKKDLPGTVLFPATKFISVAGVANAATVKDGTSSETGSGNIELSVKLVPRFLVVSRERFLVLQVAAGAPMGIGSEATVVLNEHLTQLIRVTFRKKDPEMINLFFKNDGSIVNSSIREDEEDSTDEERIRRYRVSKRAELVETLQRNMQRFK